MIFWCLLAFIGSGYEHSVANMTLLTLANLLPHPDAISWGGMISNLVPVTIGNIISGSIFLGAAYVFVSGKKTDALASPYTAPEPAE
jgi:nitrite transporter